MKTFNEPIPDGKLGQFDEILKQCGGRYLRNPIEAPDQYGRYRVSYEYDNMEAANKHDLCWSRVTTEIRERNQAASLKTSISKFTASIRQFLSSK